MNKTSQAPHFVHPHPKNRLISLTSHSLETRRPRSNSSQRHQHLSQMRTTHLMGSIKKAVKQNDVSFLAATGRDRMRTEPVGAADFQATAHRTLVDVRRKFDATRTSIVGKFEQTERLKNLKQLYAKQEDETRRKLTEARSRTFSTRNSMPQAQELVQCVQVDKKVLLHMVDRLKQDIIYYRRRINESKRVTQKQELSLRKLRLQGQKLTVQTSNAGQVLTKLYHNLEEEERERSRHLEELRARLQEKQLYEQQERQRLQYQELEAERAMLAKDPTETGWQSLCLSHKFLKRVLENKITKQMNKFKVVELAFRKIKSRTEVKNTTTLVDRFLNRQKIYGQLLGEVTKTKDKHNQLKAQYTRLSLQNQKLLSQNQHLLNLQYSHQNFSQTSRSQQAILNRHSQVTMLQVKMNEWLRRQLARIAHSDRRYQILKQSLKKGKFTLPEMFKQLLYYIDDLLAKVQMDAQVDQLCLDMQEVAQVEIPEQSMTMSTMVRVKEPKQSIVRSSKLYHSLGPNSSVLVEGQGFGRGEVQQFRQFDFETYRVEEEISMVNNQREQVHLTNEKYMRQLRAKHTELKKKKLQK